MQLSSLPLHLLCPFCPSDIVDLLADRDRVVGQSCCVLTITSSILVTIVDGEVARYGCSELRIPSA